MAILGRSTLKRYFKTGLDLGNRKWLGVIDSVANLAASAAQNFASNIEFQSFVADRVSAGSLNAQVLTAGATQFVTLRQGVSATTNDTRGFPVLLQQTTVAATATGQVAFLPTGSSISGIKIDVLAASSAAVGGTQINIGNADAIDFFGVATVSGTGSYSISTVSASRLQNVSGAVFAAGITATAGANFIAGIEYAPRGSSTPGVNASFTASAKDSTGQTTYTFSSVSVGTAADNRQVVVGVHSILGSPGITINSVTIGGISASRVVKQESGSGGRVAEFWKASVPAGTTGNIVVTASAAMLACSIGVWAVYGASTATFDTDGSNVNPASVTLSVPTGGIALGFGVSNASSTATWTNLTEDLDDTVQSSNFTGARASFNTAQDVAIACTFAGGPDQIATVFASWTAA